MQRKHEINLRSIQNNRKDTPTKYITAVNHTEVSNACPVPSCDSWFFVCQEFPFVTDIIQEFVYMRSGWTSFGDSPPEEGLSLVLLNKRILSDSKFVILRTSLVLTSAIAVSQIQLYLDLPTMYEQQDCSLVCGDIFCLTLNCQNVGQSHCSSHFNMAIHQTEVGPLDYFKNQHELTFCVSRRLLKNKYN